MAEDPSMLWIVPREGYKRSSGGGHTGVQVGLGAKKGHAEDCSHLEGRIGSKAAMNTEGAHTQQLRYE